MKALQSLAAGFALSAILVGAAQAASLFGSDGLNPAFCKEKAIRQTVVYIDDTMMAEGKTDWATKISSKLKATLVPGEPVTVVRLSPASGQSSELWTGCWPAYSAARREEIAKQNHWLEKDPIAQLADQQTFFMRDFGSALTKIYLDGKRPEAEVKVDASKPPQKQLLRAIASDEGRFSNSPITIRAVIYSDMMENSDLGSVYVPLPNPVPKYAEKLGSRLRRGVFYAFGVASDVVGNQSALEEAKSFWSASIKALSASVGGFGADLNVSNNIPVKATEFNLSMTFDGQDLDGKMLLLIDQDGTLVDSWLTFSRLSITGITGTYKCQSDLCKLDANTNTGIVTDSPSEIVTLSGKQPDLAGHIGIKGTKTFFDIKASAPNT